MPTLTILHECSRYRTVGDHERTEKLSYLFLTSSFNPAKLISLRSWDLLLYTPGVIGKESTNKSHHAGVRVDTWVETGTEISPFYDSLIAKLMVHGNSRENAVCKMQDALSETHIGGIPNNLEYLKAILASNEFGEGDSLSCLPPLSPPYFSSRSILFLRSSFSLLSSWAAYLIYLLQCMISGLEFKIQMCSWHHDCTLLYACSQR